MDVVVTAGGITAVAWTAVGTVALAVATLAVVVTTIVITVQDRHRADEQLRDERKHADERLERQLKHSEAQLRDEREHARREQQEADAWAVKVHLWTQVVPGQPDAAVRRLAAIVENSSARTVKGAEGRFSPDGKSVIPAESMAYLRGERPRKEIMTDMSGYGDILVPGDGVEIASGAVPGSQLAGPYPIVRWTDMQGQRWEHRRGEVRRVADDEPWLA